MKRPLYQARKVISVSFKQKSGPGYGSCGDEVLVLQRLCDGTLVHL